MRKAYDYEFFLKIKDPVAAYKFMMKNVRTKASANNWKRCWKLKNGKNFPVIRWAEDAAAPAPAPAPAPVAPAVPETREIEVQTDLSMSEFDNMVEMLKVVGKVGEKMGEKTKRPSDLTMAEYRCLMEMLKNVGKVGEGIDKK
jgi:hypothetical protein